MTGELSITAEELSRRLEGRLDGCGTLTVRGVNAIEDAGGEEITLIASSRYARRWADASAGAAVVTEGLEPAGHDPATRALIYVQDAELAMALLLELFAPETIRPDLGVAPTSWVHETARLGTGVRVGHHVTVDAGCVIGDDVVLHPGVRLYPDVHVGAGSELHGNCVVRERCSLGERVILHQNVSIGSDGFGYRPAPDGSGLVKVPQIGSVRIDDDVEIGANSCVDRAKFGETRIGAGTKIDNLVQVAHNCRIGRACVLAGQCGLAGSVVLGDGVQLAGAAGVADHRSMGDGSTLGSRASLLGDVPPGEVWAGTPAVPIREALRQTVAIRKLPGLMQRIAKGL